MKKVIAFGTFDIFHKGHEYFLQEAKRLGDKLVVVVARDKTVEEVKGEKPHNDEEKRLSVVQKEEYVDKAVLGSEGEDKMKVVEDENPDIVCIGYDQNSFTEHLHKRFRENKFKIVKIGPFQPEKYKSSILKKNKV